MDRRPSWLGGENGRGGGRLQSSRPEPRPLGKLGWRHVPQRAVRPDLVVVETPRLDLAARVGQVDKPVLVQALVTKLAVEALDEAVLDSACRAG